MNEIIQATPGAANIIYAFQQEIKRVGEATKQGKPIDMDTYTNRMDELLILMAEVTVVTGFGDSTEVIES